MPLVDFDYYSGKFFAGALEMPYPRRVGRRRVVMKRKRVYRRKATTTVALARKVKYLARQMRQKSPPLLLTRSFTTGMASPLVSYGLDQYPSMTPVFGTAADDMECNRVLDKSDVMDITVTLESPVNNEEETINFTAYIVQLKDAIGGNYTGGALALTNSIHYVSAPNPGGHALLNLKYFKILKSKKFTLTNYGTALGASAAQSQYGTSRRWTWKLNQKRLIQNPTGNFGAQAPVDPSQARFLIVFTDNSIVDAESPTIYVNHVKSLRQIA